MLTRHSWSTVRPPTPESNMPIGRSGSACRGWRGAPAEGYDPAVRLLCIHHEPTSDGGTLLAPARAGGWTIEHWHAHAGEPRPILDDVAAVLAYGGPMNPDDDERLTSIADVRATLAEA